MSEMLKCCHCSKSFSTRSNLLTHQKTARYCLKIQGKEIKKDFICSGCGTIFTQKTTCKRHSMTCPQLKENQYKQQIRKLEEVNEMQLEQICALKDRILELEKQLSREEGKTEVLAKQKTGSKTVNNYINPKLLSITTDTIRPFTLDTIREEIENGGYTKEMFNRGTLGIVEFVSNMISHENADGTIERSYVCTDVSRNKFHRLVESKEWKSDNGAHFLNGVLDQIAPHVEEHYQDIVEKRRKAQAEEDEVEYEYYNNRVDETRPLYQGVKFKKGDAREKLFINLRNKISRTASV